MTEQDKILQQIDNQFKMIGLDMDDEEKLMSLIEKALTLQSEKQEALIKDYSRDRDKALEVIKQRDEKHKEEVKELKEGIVSNDSLFTKLNDECNKRFKQLQQKDKEIKDLKIALHLCRGSRILLEKQLKSSKEAVFKDIEKIKDDMGSHLLNQISLNNQIEYEKLKKSHLKGSSGEGDEYKYT